MDETKARNEEAKGLDLIKSQLLHKDNETNQLRGRLSPEMIACVAVPQGKVPFLSTSPQESGANHCFIVLH